MEHAVLPRLVFHQQIKASGGAAQHVAHVAGGQDDTLGLARCPRGIDDGDGVRLREFWVSVHAGAGMRKYLVEQILRRGRRPGLQNAIAQRGIAAADDCRGAVLHHGDEFGGRLARVERNYDQSFRHDREIERRPSRCRCAPAGRSGRLSSDPCDNRNARACATSFSNPWPPRPQLDLALHRGAPGAASCLPAASSWAKMFSRKFMCLRRGGCPHPPGGASSAI